MLTASPLGTPTNTHYSNLSIKFGVMVKRHGVLLQDQDQVTGFLPIPIA